MSQRIAAVALARGREPSPGSPAGCGARISADLTRVEVFDAGRDPLRVTILVHELRPDALSEVRVHREPRHDPVVILEHAGDVELRCTRAGELRDGDGERQRAHAPHRFRRSERALVGATLQRCQQRDNRPDWVSDSVDGPERLVSNRIKPVTHGEQRGLGNRLGEVGERSLRIRASRERVAEFARSARSE